MAVTGAAVGLPVVGGVVGGEVAVTGDARQTASHIREWSGGGEGVGTVVVGVPVGTIVVGAAVGAVVTGEVVGMAVTGDAVGLLVVGGVVGALVVGVEVGEMVAPHAHPAQLQLLLVSRSAQVI
ncbi:hypothetical protein CYMTET_28988 [Cymbomonas tetramitiformis]|uniref:Uncharacterized protein n=1 Tax=Cymbomonas tetramitiformis TaxID=36881 RepID=A0AAE0KVE5_9CHLO|nr:hypothetical protein CYMTET_28988 [Cymbomonas tetramitiformis]